MTPASTKSAKCRARVRNYTGYNVHKQEFYQDGQSCPWFTKFKKSVRVPCQAWTKRGFPCKEWASWEVEFGEKVLACGSHSGLIYRTWQTRGAEVAQIIERWANGAQDRYGAEGAEKGVVGRVRGRGESDGRV
jgi:hypothetical protein